MTIYILFFIFHVIIYGPRICNKHLNININIKSYVDKLIIFECAGNLKMFTIVNTHKIVLHGSN